MFQKPVQKNLEIIAIWFVQKRMWWVLKWPTEKSFRKLFMVFENGQIQKLKRLWYHWATNQMLINGEFIYLCGAIIAHIVCASNHSPQIIGYNGLLNKFTLSGHSSMQIYFKKLIASLSHPVKFWSMDNQWRLVKSTYPVLRNHKHRFNSIFLIHNVNFD